MLHSGVRCPLSLGLLLLALFIARAGADVDPAFQEPGVLYFAGNLPDKITVSLLTPTTLYLEKDFQTALASLPPGTELELVGMSPQGFLIKTNYRNNTVRGWIHPDDLPTGVDPSLFTQAQATQDRHTAVTAAIAHKQVIQGMTPDEVTQSLGRPDQVATRTDATTSALTWIFTTYKNVPQTSWQPGYYGRLVLVTTYIRVPTGQTTVNFTDGLVSSIESHQTTGPGVVTD